MGMLIITPFIFTACSHREYIDKTHENASAMSHTVHELHSLLDSIRENYPDYYEEINEQTGEFIDIERRLDDLGSQIDDIYRNIYDEFENEPEDTTPYY